MSDVYLKEKKKKFQVYICSSHFWQYTEGVYILFSSVYLNTC